MVGDLRAIYAAANEDAAAMALNDFKDKWDGRYPTISASWQRNWAGIVLFLAYPPVIRKVVYTTDEMDKRFLWFCGMILGARMTSWRRATQRLEAPSGCLIHALPA